MDFTIGRDDISVTVYVPWNCCNHCQFCSSKQDYDRIKPNVNQLMKNLEFVRESIIPIVVFTGGEPSSNLPILERALEVVKNKVVYINTSLPSWNAEGFIELVNSTPWVRGVSISRHCTTFEEDSCLLNNIAPDAIIAKFRKPVRINVVERCSDSFSHQNLMKYVQRWEKISQEMLRSTPGILPLTLNLRGDYNKQDPHTLHELSENSVVNELATSFFYHGHSFCNVCDTCSFTKYEEGKAILYISYHRGLATTAIKIGPITEVNDVIVLQDGSLAYDWDGKNQGLGEFMELIKSEEEE